MIKKSKKRNLIRKQKIAKVTLAIFLLLCGLWLLPLAGSILRPYVVLPQLVTLASDPKSGDEELRYQLSSWQIDDASIIYLIDMKQKKLDTVVYPRLGMRAPLTIGEADPTAVRDWKAIRQNLSQGVYGSFGKKEVNHSTLYLIGHSSDYDIFNQYASVFAPLGQSKAGDRVVLLRDSNFYLIQMIDTKTIQPNDIDSYELFGKPFVSDREQVVFVTCWPVLTTRSRLLVRGMVGSTFEAQ